MLAATKIFASNFNAKMAQRFYNVFLLVSTISGVTFDIYRYLYRVSSGTACYRDTRSTYGDGDGQGFVVILLKRLVTVEEGSCPWW